jgi:hypothetical protein
MPLRPTTTCQSNGFSLSIDGPSQGKEPRKLRSNRGSPGSAARPQPQMGAPIREDLWKHLQRAPAVANTAGVDTRAVRCFALPVAILQKRSGSYARAISHLQQVQTDREGAGGSNRRDACATVGML